MKACSTHSAALRAAKTLAPPSSSSSSSKLNLLLLVVAEALEDVEAEEGVLDDDVDAGAGAIFSCSPSSSSSCVASRRDWLSLMVCSRATITGEGTYVCAPAEISLLTGTANIDRHDRTGLLFWLGCCPCKTFYWKRKTHLGT